ncbi:MAG: deoxyribonuclease V [Chitinophagales bacterium]
MLTHKWDVSPKEAIEIQKKLQAKVRIEPLQKEVKYIAGADISFNRGETTVYASIVVLRLSDLQEVERSLVVGTIEFPYIPGLLSFREVPLLWQAWQQLQQKPDVLVLDGHGIAHNRRFGVASHFGLLVDVPTIGCAKKIFVGTHAKLNEEAGSTADIYDNNELLGVVLRSRSKVKPIYISVGHRITLPEALKLMQHCISTYRLPAPTRQAHLIANQMRRGEINIS